MKKVNITNIEEVHLNPFAIKDNLLMDDVDLAIEEAKRGAYVAYDTFFMVCPTPKTTDLEKHFRHEVFKMLKTEGKINDKANNPLKRP